MLGWHVTSYDCAKISHQNSTDPLDYPFGAASKSVIHCADNINEKTFDYALFIDKSCQEWYIYTLN